ncbi:methionyl-tRNA formyltransferase [Akkermansiaceae bacterium]|nr:methionyl-tRNA formyltransferase [Akkermansiaceae bacterium]MDB4544862.1 methionyl-tRNA formyltransferase [Akkermansiaceae bacterium]
MRIVFMATGEIAEPTFSALLESGHEVAGLVTQPDRPVGRKQVLTAPGVKDLALKAGLPVIQPESVREEDALDQIRKWAPDLIVVMAYGQILPLSLIRMPTRAIINLHASLLPKYRGAACIQGAIVNGDHETGWSVIHVLKKLDAGNIVLQHPFEIAPEETGGQLHDRLALAGPAALTDALELFEEGEVPGTPQVEADMTYVPKLLREDGRIDWSKSATEIARMIRAYHPWPGTFAELGGKRLKVFPPVRVGQKSGKAGEFLGLLDGGVEVACGVGSLVLSEVQPEGSRRMSSEELARGRREALNQGLK